MAACAALGIGLVGAQFVFTGNPFFHTWQYAAMLAILAVVALRYAKGGVSDRAQRGAVVALTGALIVIAGGATSGLLGADTQTIVRSPGVVAPIPDVQAAAFFPVVDAGSFAQPTPIIMRRRGHPELSVVPGRQRYLDASILSALPRTAAYIEVHDAGGNHVTITQPSNVSFLSPVVLFMRTEEIEGKHLPADSFAVPAAHRIVRVLYFSPEQTANFKSAASVSGKEALLFAMTDDKGAVMPGQIAVALSGQEVKLDRLRIRATIGRYPALSIASAPHPLPFAVGTLMFLGGFVMLVLVRTPPVAPVLEGVQRVR